MVKQEQTKFRTIQLTEGVLVSTPIEEFCIPALRAGFLDIRSIPVGVVSNSMLGKLVARCAKTYQKVFW